MVDKFIGRLSSVSLLFNVISFLLGCGITFLLLKSTIVKNVNQSLISPQVTPSIEDILAKKFPEFLVEGNTMKLKGNKSEDFTIYINPPGRGLDPESTVIEEVITINNVKYNKLLYPYFESNKVDIFFTPIDVQNQLSLEIVANEEKILSATGYGLKILETLHNYK